MPRPIISYNPVLKSRARELRRHMTLAEVLLWNRLKRRQLGGRDFDRQRPIGEHIVDFFCKDLRLAIEVDGRSHDFKEEADARRQRQLESQGVWVIRFWDAEVNTDIESVLARIGKAVQEREQALANPPRPPSAATPPGRGSACS